MKEIILDGNLMKENPHKYLKEKFDFPEYYGENLDALYDCLGDICKKTRIILKNSSNIDNKIIATFKDAEYENTAINMEIK